MYENRKIFKIGDIVCSKDNPEKEMIIKQFVNNIYYCIIYEYSKRKDMVFFERDLQLFNSKK